MRYLVRQKVFSIRDSFTIKDEYGNDVFKVFGRLLSIGNKLTLTDLLDQELYYIEQRLFRFLPEYTIYRNGRPVATVKKNLTLFRPSFDISSVMEVLILMEAFGHTTLLFLRMALRLPSSPRSGFPFPIPMEFRSLMVKMRRLCWLL